VLEIFRKEKRIIGGVDDLILPLSEVQLISKKTNTPLIIIDSGHMSWVENSSEMLKFIPLND
jgi:hypothetical protein